MPKLHSSPLRLRTSVCTQPQATMSKAPAIAAVGSAFAGVPTEARRPMPSYPQEPSPKV